MFLLLLLTSGVSWPLERQDNQDNNDSSKGDYTSKLRPAPAIHKGNLSGGNHGSVLTGYEGVDLRMSHYIPSEGGINCDADCSTMASGDNVIEWLGGKNGRFAAACPQEWGSGTMFVVEGVTFECRDHGGWINCYKPGDYDPALEKHAMSFYCWVDTLGDQGYTYGDTVSDWYFTEYETDALNDVFGPVYTCGVISQGEHGHSYGHAAIDIVACDEDLTIYTPIHGTVTRRYIDEYDNTVLVIENDYWIVTLMHGLFTVAEGETVRQGQPVGKEDNFGYTMNSAGVLCHGRDGCGDHTHVNVYEKRSNRNVNMSGRLIGE